MSDNHKYLEPLPEKISPLDLQADCERCFGLCCVSLSFAASVDFAQDKEAGQPCTNLRSDFRCGVHTSLRKLGFRGCTVFDCFGAGQKISQITFSGHDWRQAPDSAKQMFNVFPIMRDLHELLSYLNEAITLDVAHSIHPELRSALIETQQLTLLPPDSLHKVDVATQRAKINVLLLQTSELVRTEVQRKLKNTAKHNKAYGRGANLIGANLRGADLRGANLRGAYLIAADLRNADLRGADLIGADFRDTDLRGSNLTESIFLTQAQLNAAKGDASTQISPAFTRPAHWCTSSE